MATPPESVPAAIHELIEANRAARRILRQNEIRLQRGLREIEDGHGARHALERNRPDEPRRSTNDALEAYETARHNLRLAVIRELLADGMTIGEVGRTWGFSRQLASRYARELEGPTSS